MENLNCILEIYKINYSLLIKLNRFLEAYEICQEIKTFLQKDFEVLLK